MEMIAFTEAYTRTAGDASLAALKRATEAAALQGWKVVSIPADLAGEEADAIMHLPNYELPCPAIWIGFIPEPKVYQALWEAASKKNIWLLNDLAAHLQAQEFDRYYPRLAGLTPRSVVLTDLDALASAEAELGFPIFVRGTLQSRKFMGLNACLANDSIEFKQRIEELLPNARSRGRVIARQYIPLKHVQTHQGFPQGREYRVFLLDRQVVEMGYYWQQADSLAPLSAVEAIEVRNLAQEAASRLDARWVAIDIGQAETGKWWVIESGDAQFSGLAQASPMKLFGRLREMLNG